MSSIAFRIPIELIVIMLSYLTDDYKIRQGKLIQLINKKTDPRYKLLKEISPLITFPNGANVTLCIFDKDDELSATYHLYGSNYGFNLSASKRTSNTVNSELGQNVTIFRNFCGKNGCGYNKKCLCENELYYNNLYIKKVIEERKIELL